MTTSGGLLTPRQREALEHAGDGRTLEEIAYEMGVSRARVNQLLAEARSSLGAATTTQAAFRWASLRHRSKRRAVPEGQMEAGV